MSFPRKWESPSLQSLLQGTLCMLRVIPTKVGIYTSPSFPAESPPRLAYCSLRVIPTKVGISFPAKPPARDSVYASLHSTKVGIYTSPSFPAESPPRLAYCSLRVIPTKVGISFPAESPARDSVYASLHSTKVGISTITDIP